MGASALLVVAMAGCGGSSGPGKIAITVDGNVQISRTSDLRALAGTVHIGGNLDIRVSDLTSLAGLESLTTVDGHLHITLNSKLTDLTGLSGLTTVGGDSVEISSNPALVSATLPALSSVAGELIIDGNTALTGFSLPALTTLPGGSARISNNPALLDVDGLSALHTIGGSLDVESDGALTSVEGLNGVTSIPGDLLIWENATLETINLPSLTTIGMGAVPRGAGPFNYDLFITTNTMLRTINMPALRTIGRGGLRIHENPVLNQCQADALTAQVGGTCECSGNNGADPCG